jgi:hypothetical protein
VGLVVFIAAVDWVGWATGIHQLTRINPSWPPMTPWSALWLAALAAAILVQAGHPSRGRVWAGQSLAAVVGALAVAMFMEYATARSFGLDHVWFGEGVRTLQSSWPGRPSPQTASAVLLLATAVVLTRLEPRWTWVVRLVCMASVGMVAFVAAAAYLFDAMALVKVGRPAWRSRVPWACCCWSARRRWHALTDPRSRGYSLDLTGAHWFGWSASWPLFLSS